MEEKGFSLISLLITIVIILIIIGSSYFGYNSFRGRQTQKETGKDLIEEAERLKEQETERLEKQIEEVNK
jgi:Tfp pilus assembly protein PilE